MNPIDIVGNGPSRVAWRRTTREAVGCNLFDGGDYVALADRQLLERAMANPNSDAFIRIPRPAILGHNAEEFSHQLNLRRRVNVFGVVKKNGEIKNAGQVACAWALAKGHRELHLWGFDSLWTGNRTTFTDDVFGKKKVEACPKWERGWDYIAETWKDAVLVLHAPEGAALRNRDRKRQFRLEHFNPEIMG